MDKPTQSEILAVSPALFNDASSLVLRVVAVVVIRDVLVVVVDEVVVVVVEKKAWVV